VDSEGGSDQKRSIEAQRDQLKAQIRYKEQVVADQNIVAKSLANFSKAFYALPFADREELIGLLIKSLKVARIDPTVDAWPAGLDALVSEQFVKWYRIEVEFYIQSIFGGQPEVTVGLDADSE